jgi:tight adherence protein C
VSGAAALAGLAGVAGAAAIVELAAARAGRGPRTGRRAGREARSHGATAALARLGRRVGAPAAGRDLGALLAAAGAPPAIAPSDLMAVKAGAGATAALVAAPLVASAPLRMVAVLICAAAAAGFVAPDAWLRRRARQRAARAALELADVLDLLRVAVEAGLPTGRALAEVGRRRGGLVGVELCAAAGRVDLGLPRSAALAETARRLPTPGVLALVAAVDRADRLGAPLGPALAALAAEARAQRARRLHDAAAAAAPRIQLAVAMLLVPAVLLLVAAGLVHGLA